jgi:hypothetical protein
MTALPLLCLALASLPPPTSTALSLALPSEPAPARIPELVAIPPRVEGLDAKAGLEAWKTLTQELESSRKQLGVSIQLQKQQHDFLVGPAREQARDCQDAVECLSEIGTTLGADVLVTGKVTATEVSLFAIDVSTQKRIADANALGKKSQLSQLRTRAAKALIKKLEAARKAAPAAATASSAAGAAKKDEASEAGKEAEATNAAGTQLGTLMLAPSQLQGVSSVVVDGASVPFGGDGELRWEGTAGTHTLTAVHADGRRLTQDVVLRPGEITTTTLSFASLAPAAEAIGAPIEPPVTSRWWFWTSVLGAVIAGSATAAVLAGGEKGGPSLASESGTIRGTY